MRNFEGFSEGISEDEYSQYRQERIFGDITVEAMRVFLKKKRKLFLQLRADHCDIDQRLRGLVGEDPKSDVVQTEIGRHYDLIRSMWGMIAGEAIKAVDYNDLARIYKRTNSWDKTPDLRFSRFMRMAIEYFANIRVSPQAGGQKTPKKKQMKGVQHEVWQDTEGLTMLFRADKRGDEKSLQPDKDAILLHSFYASSHFEAMSAYYHFMGWGTYKTDHETDKEPYPELKRR